MKSTPKESNLQSKIMDHLREQGYWCRKQHVSKYSGQVGDPDIFAVLPVQGDGVLPGIPVAMETKRDDEEDLSDIQYYRLQKMREQGFVCAPIYKMSDYYNFLDQVSKLHTFWMMNDE